MSHKAMGASSPICDLLVVGGAVPSAPPPPPPVLRIRWIQGEWDTLWIHWAPEKIYLGVGGFGTRPWWLALLACGGAYWPLAFETSAMTSRHPYYCGHPGGRGGGAWSPFSNTPPPLEGGSKGRLSFVPCFS